MQTRSVVGVYVFSFYYTYVAKCTSYDCAFFRYTALHGSRAIPQLLWTSFPHYWVSIGAVCNIHVHVCAIECVSLCAYDYVRGFVMNCMLMTCRYDSKCDVWSIGCILWDMANNKDKFVFVSSL